jgi:genome maintenance exonuclease 1|tara:strand:+ start:1274 stop:1972 length:699 start_codon:yes stop_codon:yes gene_type:complete
MILNKLYEYPTSTRAAINSLRHYSINGSNAKLPSVTTILSQTQSEDKAMSLQRWRDRVGAAAAAKITNDAATRGTAMHMYLEKHCLNEGYLDLTPTGTQAKTMADIVIDRGLSRVDEVYGTEATLYYPDLYAGSVDLVARLDGEIAIIDFKQTNKPKQRSWIGDYFLQMAAYGMAHDHIYGTEINKGVIMMCSKDNYYQEFVIEGEEYRNAKHGFLAKLDQFYKNRPHYSEI